jgi:hypothetical protein
MKMQNTYKGYWSIVKGKTRILVHPGQSNPYKPHILYLQHRSSSQE